jgi:hypothetical protein
MMFIDYFCSMCAVSSKDVNLKMLMFRNSEILDV